MRRSVIERKLRRVDTALDKAITKNEVPGAVVLARMPRDGELLEHASVRGLAVVRPERLPMTRETLFDLASLAVGHAAARRDARRYDLTVPDRVENRTRGAARNFDQKLGRTLHRDWRQLRIDTALKTM